MFGLKVLRERIERIEGSLFWVARELSGPNGLASLAESVGKGLAGSLETHRRRMEEETVRLAASIEAVRGEVSAVQARISATVGELARLAERVEDTRNFVAAEATRSERERARIYEVVAGIENNSVLRERLDLKTLELEALGEQAMRLIEILHATRREVEALKAHAGPPEALGPGR